MDIQHAQETVRSVCRQMGLQDDIEVTEIKHQTRWVLAYTQSEHHPDFGRHMIRLETAIRYIQGLELIEIQCEAEADRNKRDIKSGRGTNMVNARNVESLD